MHIPLFTLPIIPSTAPLFSCGWKPDALDLLKPLSAVLHILVLHSLPFLALLPFGWLVFH